MVDQKKLHERLLRYMRVYEKRMTPLSVEMGMNWKTFAKFFKHGHAVPDGKFLIYNHIALKIDKFLFDRGY